MDHHSKRATRCVLCRTCANSVARDAAERRATPRICAAGLEPGPQLFECESYVRRANGTSHDSSGEARA
ncbi:MAG TPA: hypothetical protein VEC19_11330 [Usitatibacter sp.]|nr:hypothetical protein [Usitatibacter sp.]